MSEYKSIKGKTVQFLGTDPSETSTEGQVWYNSTAGAFKSLFALEAWSSGAPLINEHQDTSAAGTQTAGLCFGGTPPSDGITNTEEYNGSGWATGGALNTGRRAAARFSASTQTAGLVFGGSGTPNPTVLNATEEYNGTAWTSVNNLPAVKYVHGGAGIQTAALSFGGYDGTATVATTEVYDGTNWTAGNAMGTGRYSFGSAGLQTAALAFGGTPPVTAATEEYDGTSWTAGGDMNNARRYVAGCGLQTSALAFGAGPAAIVLTEMYDGSSWSNTVDMGIAQKNHGGAGSQAAALSCGGESPTNSRFVTQEFNKSINVITGAAWASGGNLNLTRSNTKGGGIQTAAITTGGQTAPGSPTGFTVRAETETYDGTSWSEVADMSNSRREFAAFGTQGATVAFGGENPGDAQLNATENWNGSSWTAGGNYPVEIGNHSAAGIQTAGLCAGGSTPGGITDLTCEYDGSTWTSTAPVGNIGTARYGAEMAGTQTAGLIFGGAAPARNGLTEEYDGTSWTSSNTMNTNLRAMGSAGIQTAALSFGGAPGEVTTTEQYNGTNWVTSANMASGRSYLGGCGTTAAALAMGKGSTPTAEEFTGETSAINFKTLTTS